MMRVWPTPISWGLVLLLAVTTPLIGQTLRGEIVGTVTDESSAALPGVSVMVTSPSLQVPQILRISDARGEYQVVDLPPGTYRVAYELPGFATLVREGIVLTTGFSARLDVALKVAAVAETITVSGESPLVDVTNTRGGTTVSKDLIAATPGNMTYQDVLLLVAGTQGNSPPLTGEIRAGRWGSSGQTYGAGAGTNTIEGVRMNPNEGPDIAAMEEVDVKTFGNTADIDTPGAAISLIIKSGGNQFHGRYKEVAQHRRFQSDNLDAALRSQGITTGDAIQYYNDFAGDLGGRIIRDKLWFYGAVRDLRNKRTQSGYVKDAGPDGIYATADDTPGFPTARHLSTTVKISYQPTSKHRFTGFSQFNPDYEYEAWVDRFTPYESSLKQYQISQEAKPVEWQGTLSNQLLVNMMYGLGGYNSVFWYPDEYRGEWKGVPARLDRTSGQFTGPNFNSSGFGGRKNKPWRDQLSGSVNYLPTGSLLGSHAIQAGYRVWWGRLEYQNPQDPEKNAGIGEYQLIYDTVGGVRHQPVEMAVRNVPVHGISGQDVYAAYVQDTWRPARRVTLNLGLRWERSVQFVPPQVKVQGTFGTSGTFPKVDAGTFTAFAPRAGIAFDLAGDSRTVLKATYGWFNHDLGVNGYSSTFNENRLVTYNYRWRDPDRNDDYTPGEVNLNLNGPDFLSVSGGLNLVNPDLKLPHTHEATASLEHELGAGLSIRGLFVFKSVVDDFATVNVLRPYSVYNRAFTRRDPGGDGVLNTADDGGMVTFYDYDPAYRGAAFVGNMNITSEDRTDSFRNFEVTLTKRPTGKWFANTSFLATKNHRWLNRVAQSPNDEIHAMDETWDLSYRLAAGYEVPFGINLSTLYQAYNGLPRQRTNVFRAADPAGGPALPSSSTITLRMEPFGASRGPARHIVNLRLSRDFLLSGSRRAMLELDVFNAFNSNVPWGTATGGGGNGFSDVSGPTYGYVVRVVTPRVLRVGVGFEF
jgi:hypothetical protein